MLGDGAYSLLPWLIKPYNFGPALTHSEKLFNKKLSSARVTVERAFGILKARWRCLLKRLDNCIENVSAVVIACCVLHNICQMNRDDYLDQDGMLEAILAHERERRDRRRQNNDRIRNAEAIRLSLKRFVNMQLNSVKKYLQKQHPEVFHK